MKKHGKKAPKKTNIIEDAFENPDSKFFLFTNDVLAIVTLISVLAIVLETVASFSAYHTIFKVVEYGATALFTLEYIARLSIAKKKFSYVFSFFGIIDLLAILPTYLGLGNFTFLKAARALRILRLLRMIRLAKFAHIKRRKNAAASLYAINIQIYAVTLILAILILGTLFYIFEGHTAQGADILLGMSWAFKAILGGIPTLQPETVGGQITLIGARFTSMLLLGLLTGLAGTMVRKLLIGAEKDA